MLQTKVDRYDFNGVTYHIKNFIDRNQFSDPKGEAEALGISSAVWPFFGMVWPAGLLLADIISHQPLQGVSVLELGCGLGIASLVANARGADILATDYHPMAAEFLRSNSQRNGLADTPFRRLDWSEQHDSIGRFDLIMGSDVLYEPNHPHLLSTFLDRHSACGTRIIIVDPKRRLHSKFRAQMELLGFESHTEAVTPVQQLAFGFRGTVLRFKRA